MQGARPAERLYRYTAAQVLGLPADEVATVAGDDLLERGRSRLEMTAVRHDGLDVRGPIVTLAPGALVVDGCMTRASGTVLLLQPDSSADLEVQP